MYGMSAKQKQRRVLYLCNRKPRENMTAKEKNAELDEIFSHKLALTNKINHNRAEVYRIKKAAGYEEDPEERRKMKDMMKTGESLVDLQVIEREKLSVRKISNQLGYSEGLINYRYRVYCKSAA